MVAVKQKLAARDEARPMMRLVGTGDDQLALEEPMPLRLPLPPRRQPGISRHQRERRVFPRKEVHMEVHGKRLDHTLPALRQPALTLNLRDLSVGGLSALTDLPLAPGERISVSFPSQGMRLGWDACGTVLRCEPAALGYRIAVEFEQVPSAA